MIDVDGNMHLDCCNNVACVGHSHPAVIEAACKELVFHIKYLLVCAKSYSSALESYSNEREILEPHSTALSDKAAFHLST